MALDVGTVAPAFVGEVAGGRRFALKDLRGKWVALYFYPADDTPTCTAQACTFRDNLAGLTNLGITVVGVSPDTAESHARFTEKYGLNFRLVADPSLTISTKYDVWKLKKLYGREHMGIVRTTYLIDPKGVIRKVWSNVRHARHIQQLHNEMHLLGAA